jgi:hypothetical protein
MGTKEFDGLLMRTRGICSPFTYTGGPRGRNSIFQNRIFYFWGASIVSNFSE